MNLLFSEEFACITQTNQGCSMVDNNKL